MKTTFNINDNVIWNARVVFDTGFREEMGDGPFVIADIRDAQYPRFHPQEVLVNQHWFSGAYFKKMKA